MDTRPSWDEYFLSIAREVATRSTCLRRHVGAVIVRDRRILCSGYNGSPPGQPHCLPGFVRVRLADGTSQPISRLFTRWQQQERIDVLAYNHVAGKTEAKPVTAAFRSKKNADQEWVRFTVPECKHRGPIRPKAYVSSDHDIWSVDRQAYVPASELEVGSKVLIRRPEMSPEQEQILLGCSMGDGSSGRLKHWGGYLCFTHSAKQQAYAQHKADSLAAFTSGLKPTTTLAFGKRWQEVRCYVSVPPKLANRLCTPHLDRVCDLDEIGLAYWYQDDGVIKNRRQPHFCAYMWTEEEATIAAKRLTQKWGWHFATYRASTYHGVRVAAYSADEFFQHTARHIHPSMRHKLPGCWKDVEHAPVATHLRDATEAAIDWLEVVRHGGSAYDLTVADHHNFFLASGFLVSNCTDVGCLIEDGRCIRTLHAEQNAIAQAALHGVSTRDATLYATCRPCHVCARMIVGAGIVRVVCFGDPPEGWGRDVLEKGGVSLVSLPEPPRRSATDWDTLILR